MDEGQTPLSDLLSDEPVQTPAAEPEPVIEEGPARDEHGRFIGKGEEESASPAPVDEPPAFEGAATTGERKRRQAAEQERDELRTRLAALEQKFTAPQPSEPAAPPSLWDDEQGWQQHVTSQVVQQASFNAKLDLSEMLTRRDNPDFEDMKTKFLSLAEMNPTLREKALSDPDPWGAAYRIAKNAAAIEELGSTDMEAMRAKIREEVMAEMQGQQPAPRPGLPPTLANERNVGGRSGPAWAGPTSLSDLLA